MADANFGFTLVKGGSPIGELTKITPPKVSVGDVEKTHHGAGMHEFIPNKLPLVDAFPATITLSGAIMGALWADLVDGSIDVYTITYPGDVDPWVLNCYLREIGQPEADAANPGLLSVDIMLRPAGGVDVGDLEISV